MGRKIFICNYFKIIKIINSFIKDGKDFVGKFLRYLIKKDYFDKSSYIIRRNL